MASPFASSHSVDCSLFVAYRDAAFWHPTNPMNWTDKIVAAGLICTAVMQMVALRRIRIVHQVINSRLDKWLALERSQGMTDGRQAERDEAKSKLDQE